MLIILQETEPEQHHHHHQEVYRKRTEFERDSTTQPNNEKDDIEETVICVLLRVHIKFRHKILLNVEGGEGNGMLGVQCKFIIFLYILFYIHVVMDT